MTFQIMFEILVVLYSATNLASMGLELNLPQTIKSLRSFRLVILTLVWGWVVGPAFAVLLTKILPLSEPHATGLLIFSLAPIAPFLPILIRKSHADMDFSAALMPMGMVATVVLLPLMAPWLIKGLTVNAWSLAKPLLLLVLLPLVLGAAIKVCAAPVAARLFPMVKRLAGISTLMLLGFTVIFYFPEFLRTLGSFAIAAEIIFVLGIALASYYLGFGLKQGQRSAMALGMGTRNASGMFVAFTAFANPDPHILVMILLAGPVPVLLALPLARFFASRASET